MDIAALSTVMSQSRVQQDAGIEVMEIAMNTGKENAINTTEMIQNATLDPNLGKYFNAIA